MKPDSELGYHPQLPKLKQGTGNKVGNFAAFGSWDPRQSGELVNVSESIKIERIESVVNSIPDIWARPLLFEMALFDEDHLLHKKIVGEWRGLLAMIALREIKGFQLSIAPVKVAHKDRVSGKPVGVPAFVEALSKLRPTRSLAPDTFWRQESEDAWKFPSVLLFKKLPIGMVSPTTLVCTATDCYNRLHGVRWSDGASLLDPSGVLGQTGQQSRESYLNEAEKRKLAGWVVELKSSLAKHPGFGTSSQERIGAKVLGLLDGFIGDLGGAPGSSVKKSARGIGLTEGVFRYLDKPLEADGLKADESHVRLLASENRSPSKTLLVVNPALAEQWDRKDCDIKIIGGATLSDYPFGGLGTDRSKYGSTSLPENIELRAPDDFFLDKLFLINQANALPGTLKSRGANSLLFQDQPVTPILPIKDELLLYLNHEDLSDRCTMEQTSDGIVVRLRLTLSGVEGASREIDLQRVYKFGKSEIHLLESVPVLEVWPNFKAPGWNIYYTYLSTAGSTRTFFGRPFFVDAGEVCERISPESEITESIVFPEAVLCEALEADVRSNKIDRIPAGVILLKPPQVIRAEAEAWRVGVDFGTTSTNVFFASAKHNPSPVVFNDKHLLQVTSSGALNRMRLYYEFLPWASESAPFLTFYAENKPHSGAERMEYRPILDGHIHFLDKSKDPEKIPENVSTDLKWSTKFIDRDRSAAFLKQACLQCAAEAVSHGARAISWRYSYPTAFSNFRTSGLPELWDDILDVIGKRTGLVNEPAPIMKTESLASAVYFADQAGAPTVPGTVCIDIGGGTSDIAIWQEDKLRYQISLRLAGRELFLDLLRAKPQFLERFGVDVSSLLALSNRRPESFYAQADAIIGAKGDSWFKQLPKHVGEEETEEFIQVIAIGLSGLFYYVGLVLKHLIENEKYSPQIPDIYVGGNGSKMLHWLASGAYKGNSPINDLFREILLVSSGMKSGDDKIKFSISKHPKAEASYGLVGARELVATDGAAMISGERFSDAGTERSWDFVIDPDMFKRGLKPPQRLEQLERFIETFNRCAAKPTLGISPISDSTLQFEIKKRMSGRLHEFTKVGEAKEIVAEPFFILALKTLLSIRIEGWRGDKE